MILSYIFILGLSYILLLLINKFFYNHKLLIYKNYLPHKDNFKNIVLSGGSYFLITLTCFVTYISFMDLNYVLLFSPFIFYLVGLLSDSDFKISPVERLLIIFFTSIFIFILLDIKINKINIEIIDKIIANKIVNIIFCSSCLTVLINGGNFIDGKHGNFLLYYILVFLFLGFYLSSKYFYVVMIIIPFLINNFNEKNFLGDNGSYYFSSIIGLLLIYLQNKLNLNPFVVANILAYPTYECLFSYLRRIFNKKKTYKPDKKHLHHLIHVMIKKKFIYQKRWSNTYTSFFLFFLNSIHFIFIWIYMDNTIVLKKIFFLYFFIYIFIYYFIKFYLFKNFKNFY